jgi:hypothetical protein
MVDLERATDSGPVSPFSRLSNMINLFNVELSSFRVLVGDAFLLHRTAVVWGCDRRFYVFPLVLLVASIGTYLNVKFDQSHPEPLTQLRLLVCQLGGDPNGGYLVNTRWIVPFIATTLCTNFAHVRSYSPIHPTPLIKESFSCDSCEYLED